MKLKHLINQNGDLKASMQELAQQEELALDAMKGFLGQSIVKNNQRFILSELELYYGGIGDMAHDWYRRNFPEKYKDGKHKRCDIVVGQGHRVFL